MSETGYNPPPWACIEADVTNDAVKVNHLPQNAGAIPGPARFSITVGSPGLRMYMSEEQWDTLNTAVKAGMAEALAKSAVTA